MAEPDGRRGKTVSVKERGRISTIVSQSQSLLPGICSLPMVHAAAVAGMDDQLPCHEIVMRRWRRRRRKMLSLS